MPHPLEQLGDEALREIDSAPDEQALEAAFKSIVDQAKAALEKKNKKAA